MAEMRSETRFEISQAFSGVGLRTSKEQDCMFCAASLGTRGCRHCLFLAGTDPVLEASEVAFLRSSCQTGPDGIEIHIDHAGGEGRFIEQRLAFET